MLYKIVIVGDNERALITRHGQFDRILGPGSYCIFGTGLTTHFWSVTDPVLKSEWTDVLVECYREVVKNYFILVETSDTEVAIVYADGKVLQVVLPGKRVLFWKDVAEIRFERIDVIAAPEVPAAKLPGLARLGAKAGALFTIVDESKAGWLFLDNRLICTLPPGTYGFWSVLAAPRVETIDLRAQPFEINVRDASTRDKASSSCELAQHRLGDPMCGFDGPSTNLLSPAVINDSS